MGQFTIYNDFPGDFTFVSNYFLDTCMPQANGEFVKVYLYLLRNASGISSSLQLSSIADIFNCTENDVLRALKYWDKAGILDLFLDERGSLTGVRLKSPESFSSPAPKETDTENLTGNPAVASAAASNIPKSGIASAEKITTTALSPSKIKELQTRDEVVQMLFVAGDYSKIRFTFQEYFRRMTVQVIWNCLKR